MIWVGNATTFILSKAFIGNKTSVGLNSKENTYIIPGNHDFLLSKVVRIPGIGLIFGNERTYHYIEHFDDCPICEFDYFNNMNFLFLGLNSNITAEQPKNTAKGKIGATQLQGIVVQLEKKKKEDEARFNSCFKIAFLHHHVIPPKKHRTSTREKIISHVLEDAPDFIEILIKYKVNLVLFGHKHNAYTRAYKKKRHKMIMSCAGSTTQYNKEHYNSFRLYVFFSDEFKLINFVLDKEGYLFQQKGRIYTYKYSNPQ